MRISDGKIFEPSIPDDYNLADAIFDLLHCKHHFYFREVIELPKKWWQRGRRFKRNGKIWQTNDSNEFDIINL